MGDAQRLTRDEQIGLPAPVRLRVLDVSPRTADDAGGSCVRTRNLLRHLSRNHDVRQFSQARLSQFWRKPFRRDVWVTDTYRERRTTNLASALASEWCYRSWIFQPVLSGALLRLTRPALLREWLGWADVALVEFPWQFAFCRRELPDGLVVLASHNLEITTRTSNASGAGVSPEKSYWLRYVGRVEKRAVASADLILAVSDADRQAYLDVYGVDPARVVEVTNGSDTDGIFPAEPEARPELRRKLGLPERPTVLFIAGVPKVPDKVALRRIEQVAQLLPDLTFLVVGGIVSTPYVAGNLVATGFVTDALPYFQAADVSLCPIEHGGGTKIKVWDSLAAGLPTVVFPETQYGTALRDGEHVVVSGKSAEELAAHVRRLVGDRAEARVLGAAGRAFVVARHDWKLGAEQLEAALLRLVAEKRPSILRASWETPSA